MSKLTEAFSQLDQIAGDPGPTTAPAKSALLIDIETEPIRENILKVYPFLEWEPYPEFDPQTVKVGNLKDPGKIAAKVGAAGQEHDKAAFEHERDRELWTEEAHIAKVWAGEKRSGRPIGCHPCFAKVGAAGWWCSAWDTELQVWADDRPETLLLNQIAIEIEAGGVVHGWNIVGFDLPFLEARARILGVQWPKLRKWPGKYYDDDRVCDLMSEFGSRQYGHNYKLSDAAMAFGRPYRTDSGADWWTWDSEKQHAYLTDDILDTLAVGRGLRQLPKDES